MIKKLYINVYGSPYVDMDQEEKIWDNIEPLPKHKLFFEGAYDSNPHNLTGVIVDSIAEFACTQIIHVYEGEECIYADVIIYDHVNPSDILEAFKECKEINLVSKNIQREQKNYLLRINKTSRHYFEEYPDFKLYDDKEGTILNYYMLSNLGADAEDIAQIIGSVVQLSESFGGFPEMIEWFKYWLSIGEYKELLFNSKAFGKSLKKHNVAISNCVFMKLEPTENSNGFNIVLKYKRRIYTLKTDRKSRIKELISESNREWKYRR